VPVALLFALENSVPFSVLHSESRKMAAATLKKPSSKVGLIFFDDFTYPNHPKELTGYSHRDW